MVRILLTGFEPFGGETVNPSHEAGVRLAGEDLPGIDLVYLCLPVVRHAAVEMVIAEMRRQRPDAVVMLGQANGRARITPERIAVNVDDFRLPDNAGNLPRDEPQRDGGPAAYLCTLPVRAMTDAIVAAGVPAAVSNTAGTFLCNHVTYGVLHAINVDRLPVRAGFVHLPVLPEQAATKPAEVTSMGLETMLAGLRAALRVVAEHCVPAATNGRTAGQLLRAYYDALDKPSLADLDDLLDGACDWTFPGARLTGPIAVRESMARPLALGLSMRHDIGYLIDRGDFAMCELIATNRLGEQTFVVAGAVVCEARDGRIVRLAAYPEAEAMTAFMAGLRDSARALRASGA